jgi:hypothetical protein
VTGAGAAFSTQIDVVSVDHTRGSDQQ